ncbi:MAG: peptidoglycan bridge formation glycyltransferase FemA/FemB family protein [Patescibacteria group bacterium]
MTLEPITDRAAWESFQTAQPYSQFTQSWAWGEFRAASGSPVRRFALVENGKWITAVQMEYRRRKFGMGYWFAGRGPVFASPLSSDERRSTMFELCEQLLKEKELRQRTLFWRFEPLSELSNPEGLVPLSFRRVPASNPATTIVLDLASSPDDLLKNMHEKTRYNIRLAERHGVTVRVAQQEKDVDAFLDLMDETAARDGFVQHPRAYLKATYQTLLDARMARIRLADLDGHVLAGNLEIGYGDTATYLYGASSSENRNVMAPFALHWNAIREAKALGFKIYDFWGANPQSKATFYYKSSWEGITRFKRGWGGREIDLVGTWDLPFNSFVYRLAFMRQFFRG